MTNDLTCGSALKPAYARLFFASLGESPFAELTFRAMVVVASLLLFFSRRGRTQIESEPQPVFLCVFFLCFCLEVCFESVLLTGSQIAPDSGNRLKKIFERKVRAYIVLKKRRWCVPRKVVLHGDDVSRAESQ